MKRYFQKIKSQTIVIILETVALIVASVIASVLFFNYESKHQKMDNTRELSFYQRISDLSPCFENNEIGKKYCYYYEIRLSNTGNKQIDSIDFRLKIPTYAYILGKPYFSFFNMNKRIIKSFTFDEIIDGNRNKLYGGKILIFNEGDILIFECLIVSNSKVEGTSDVIFNFEADDCKKINLQRNFIESIEVKKYKRSDVLNEITEK